MAASCITVTVSAAASLVAGRPVGSIGSSQSAHHCLATPVISSSIKRKPSLSDTPFSLGCRAERNSAIVARAVELDETKGGTLFSSEDSSENELGAVALPSATTTKLYVGNLPWSVDSKQLGKLFQDHGHVELVEVIYDKDTQRSRGFAFVTMHSVEDAERAIEALNEFQLEGRVLKVNYPQLGKSDGSRPARTERPPRRESSGTENKIFVGNLSWGVDDVALAELFSEYGPVVEAKVVHDRETGRSRGFAFVTMSSEMEVDVAIQALDGAEFDGRILRVNHAGDKPDRRDAPRL